MRKIILIVSMFLLVGVSIKVNGQEQLNIDSNFTVLNNRVTQAENDLIFWKRLKINGWIQAQYQHTDSIGAATVAGGNFPAYSDNRFILRRGRIKFTYEQGFAQYVLQIDVIDPTLTAPLNAATPNATGSIPFAVNVRDFYVKINAPFWKPLSLTVGMQNRPFGFEIAQSSQYRETPERSRFTQILFPNERDLGAMVTLQAPKSSPFHIIKLNAGVFNGAGIAREFDSRKDFIGQIMLNNSTKNEKIQYGIGFSYYKGGVLQTDSTVYRDISFIQGSSPVYLADKSVNNIGAYGKREYFGVDAQVSIDNILGITTLRGEYIQGMQPGVSGSTRSPEIAPVGAAYIRPFNACYFYFVHKIIKLPVQLVYKYDFYDPNTKVEGSQINSTGKFGTGDIKYTTQGFGLNYLVTSNLKFMFYYDLIKNEEVAINLFGYNKKDNLFTARVQYRF